MSFELPYEEKELLSLIARSDEKAFHTIYQQYFGKVYAMALSYLPNALMAQDMVQEVFVRIWQNRAELHTIRHFESWLIAITRNLLINELRKIYPPGWEPQQMTATDLHETLNYRELERLLAAAVEKLSTRQQQVYRLSRIEGYSHREIALQLGISVDVSREHLSKALRNIRSFLINNYGVMGVSACVLFLK
ncbi:RNA polymerase sigma factor [Longitalea luteola]|uniref:RNA polymerase sigma factor n=1 Tax=Longitalea luteola TaxID=2812563 RepID=UPI001A97AD0C|nr:sigma-70 family RNA polymerase sigma factor [Longitalea luteola]